jgi:hypothetical protein
VKQIPEFTIPFVSGRSAGSASFLSEFSGLRKNPTQPDLTRRHHTIDDLPHIGDAADGETREDTHEFAEFYNPKQELLRQSFTPAEQPPVNADGSKTEWCGQACLAFGLVCKAYGYNIARAV